MKERDFQRQAVGWLRLALPVHSWVGAIPGGDGSRTLAPGYVTGTPDLLCLVPGFPAILIELKGARGVLSHAQQREHWCLSLAGAHVFVAWSIEDLQEDLDRINVPLRARIAA